MTTILADAGYDAEWVHVFLRDELDLRSLIPPKIGRPTPKPPTGHYRRQMRAYFRRPKESRRYGQRWQAETVFSMIKRRLGRTVNARRYNAQNRALLLKAIAHNILILRRRRGFLPSKHNSISALCRSSSTASAIRGWFRPRTRGIPRNTSSEVMLSDWSVTIRFSRAFSFSSFLSRRAWSSLSPP